MVTDVREEQPENASRLIVVIDDGMVTDLREEHPVSCSSRSAGSAPSAHFSESAFTLRNLLFPSESISSAGNGVAANAFESVLTAVISLSLRSIDFSFMQKPGHRILPHKQQRERLHVIVVEVLPRPFSSVCCRRLARDLFSGSASIRFITFTASRLVSYTPVLPLPEPPRSLPTAEESLCIVDGRVNTLRPYVSAASRILDPVESGCRLHTVDKVARPVLEI